MKLAIINDYLRGIIYNDIMKLNLFYILLIIINQSMGFWGFGVLGF